MSRANPNNNDFYVYEHWRPDKGVCFYIGKGKGKRAWSLNLRSRWHKAVVSKLTSLGLSVDVRVVCTNMIEEEAFAEEIRRISMYAGGDLVNLTRGGDGLVSPVQEVRDRMSKSQKERFKRPDEYEKRLFHLKNLPPISEETRQKLIKTSTGRKHTPATIERMQIVAKVRGISNVTRAAQIAAVTGRKRAPFAEETIIKMRRAASIREEAARERRLVIIDLTLEDLVG